MYRFIFASIAFIRGLAPGGHWTEAAIDTLGFFARFERVSLGRSASRYGWYEVARLSVVTG